MLLYLFMLMRLWSPCCYSTQGECRATSSVVTFAYPQGTQLLLQVADPVHQSGSFSLGSLDNVQMSLIHLPLIPALQLCGHGLIKALRHLRGVPVVPLLSKGGSTGLLSTHRQDPGSHRLWALGPVLSGPPAVPVSVANFMVSFAEMALRWRYSGCEAPLSVFKVTVPEARLLPSAVGIDH